MSAVTLTIQSALDAIITLSSIESPLSKEGGNTRRINNISTSGLVLNGSSTPKVDVIPVDLSVTIPVGLTKTFDLTAVPSALDVSKNLDMTGYKLVAMKWISESANNDAGIEIAQGGSNPYFLWGTTGDKITVFPGMDVLYTFLNHDSLLPDVAAGAKDILLTGADGDIIKGVAYFRT